jgi:hypothetical protein
MDTESDWWVTKCIVTKLVQKSYQTDLSKVSFAFNLLSILATPPSCYYWNYYNVIFTSEPMKNIFLNFA